MIEPKIESHSQPTVSANEVGAPKHQVPWMIAETPKFRCNTAMPCNSTSLSAASGGRRKVLAETFIPSYLMLRDKGYGSISTHRSWLVARLRIGFSGINHIVRLV